MTDTIKPIEKVEGPKDLDNYIQLHERVEIHYLVDRWSAQFYMHDGDHVSAEGQGETVEEALVCLLEALRTKPSLEIWRRYPAGCIQCISEKLEAA